MQREHLFNDDKEEERGVGCDALCADDKRLKFKWAWDGFRGKDKPSQHTEAKLKNGWKLETVFRHTYYEARITRVGERVATYRVDVDDTFFTGEPLVTRLDAQLKAEKLFIAIGKDIVRQCG